MAKLYRYVKLHDRFDTQVFTFLLPNRLIKEYVHEIYSKDFVYGYQKWTVSFMKTDKHLSSYIKLRTFASGMKCLVDYAFTMVNREHFTKNETFIERGCEFTKEICTHGRKTFICLNELATMNFAQESGEFLVELEMRNMMTSFECHLKLPKENANTKAGYFERIESTYFSFGLDDWSISLYPNGDTFDTDGKPVIHVNRHTSFDHLSLLRYQMFIGEDGVYDSDVLEQCFDISGDSEGYPVNASLSDISNGRRSVTIRVDMVSVTPVSQVVIEALSRGRNRAHFYDRDKQAWMIESDIDGKYLSFKIYYTDISHVPRKFARYMCWHVSVAGIGAAGQIPSTNGCISATGVCNRLGFKNFRSGNGPFSKYYVQQDLDEGFVMQTSIPVKEITCPESIYLDQDEQKMTVYIEWLDSHLLGCPTYHRLDDVSRIQRHQMSYQQGIEIIQMEQHGRGWREIMALRAENYALEKQLHSYQQFIAKKDIRGRQLNDRDYLE